MKRLFIAINLPDKLKEILAERQKEIKMNFETDPVKWVSKENLHITLAFLGPTKESLLEGLAKELEEIDFSKFEIFPEEISYQPNREEAKLIWLSVNSDGLEKLKEKVDETLKNSEWINYSPDYDQFKPHITLGRVKSFKFKRISREEVPLLEDEYIDYNFNVDSFELMVSKLKKGGPVYERVKSFKVD